LIRHPHAYAAAAEKRAAFRGGRKTRSRLSWAAAALLVVCTAVPVPAQDATPGHIHFVGRMLFGSATGEFLHWHITSAFIDDKHPERSHVSLLVDVGSLQTDSQMRDTHLKSAHFFDVQHYPTATVTLDHVHLEDRQRFTARITLDLHGKTKTFPMNFVIVDRKTRRIAGEITLLRSDFGIGPPPQNFFHLDDHVTVRIDATVPPPGRLN
jgi:polyisoprenoid-binding protein YceI